MELKRDEIIKALECCSNNDECVGEACPYYATGCEKSMPKDTLSLIKELTEENERLREELAKSYNALDEQMNFYCSFTQSKIQDCPIDNEVAKAKADTVRKIIEKISDNYEFESRADIDTRGIYQLDLIEWIVKIEDEIIGGETIE